MKIPPQLGLAKDQIEVFNKIIAIIYPPANQQKPPPPLSSYALVANNPFFLKSST
jgi:hypothetical protein